MALSPLEKMMLMKKVLLAFIAISTILIGFTSCESNKSSNAEQVSQDSVQLEKMRLDVEKSKLELEREKLMQEKNELDEKKNKEEIIASVNKAQQILSNSTAIVTAEKAYFHTNADTSTRKKSYLVRGDIINALNANKNFVYIEFYNEYADKTSSGWIDVKDIDVY